MSTQHTEVEEFAERVRAAAARSAPKPVSGRWWAASSTPPCGRRDCRCTHTQPCERGWLTMPPVVAQGVTYERVAPCPVCRPEAATRYEAQLRASSKDVK